MKDELTEKLEKSTEEEKRTKNKTQKALGVKD